MGKIGDQAHTPHGIGEIKEIVTERGRKSFRVAGRGFSVWVEETKLRVANEGLFSYGPMNKVQEEAQNTPQYGYGDEEPELEHFAGLESTIDTGLGTPVNKKNHTTLPWNGSPQNHVDMFRKDQNILPAEYELDPDKRLHPSDSLSGNNASEPKGPLPNPDLFLPRADHPFESERTSSYRPAGLDKRYAYFDIEAHDGMDPVSEFRRDPAGYISRVGHLWTEGDHTLERFADYTHLLDIEAAQAGGIEHTAAWKDVRSKAMRLRHEGKVTIKDLAPDRIYASVEGDTGTYDTMIAKGGSMGGWGGGQSITNWNCSCDWGRWAFKRQMTYVGRLCSHAYAAYLDMQSQHIKDNPGQHFKKKTAGVVEEYTSWLERNDQNPEPSSVASYLNTTSHHLDEDDVQKLYDYVDDNPEETPERDFKVDYGNDPDEAYKTADLLRNKPLSLTPDIQKVPEKGENEWVDVTKDDRETTGPDQIVHFSAIARELHGAGITDFADGGALDSGARPIPAPEEMGADSGLPPVVGHARYAEQSDDSLLNKLRDMSTDEDADHDGHHDEHNDELRYLVDELNKRGYDTSYMVAAKSDDDDQYYQSPSNGEANFLGQSVPDWADQGYAGSGPTPKDWTTDSASYVEDNEADHHETDWADPDKMDNEDIIKFNDGRSKPQQGPRHSSVKQADSFSDSAGISDQLGGQAQLPPDDNSLGGGDLATPDTSFDPNQMMASLHEADFGGYPDADSETFTGTDQPRDNLSGTATVPKNPLGGSGGGGGSYNLAALNDPNTGYLNPMGQPTEEDWYNGSGQGMQDEMQNTVSDLVPGMPGGEEEVSGAPKVVAAGFDPAAAFDRGEFSSPEELRRAGRVGHGPTQKVRVDAGVRDGHNGLSRRQATQTPPEDFGYDGEEPDDSRYANADDGSDIVAAFQRSAGAAGVMSQQPSSSRMDDFASSPLVQGFLRTAGRHFSPEEQRELEAEFHPQGARNMPTPDDLAGTHYIAGL